jgi:hypothetical protein
MIYGVATDGDIERTKHQLQVANLLIVPTTAELGNALRDWPGSAFTDLLRDMTPIYKGAYFEVFKRRGAPVSDGDRLRTGH